jgi:hypothetical protein
VTEQADTENGSVRRRPSSFELILVATVIAGIASYGVTIIVPGRIGLAAYSVFAVFWAALYLVVGALSGVQQEITRGTHRVAVGSDPQANRSRNLALVAAAVVFVVVIASSPLWAEAVFPSAGYALVWPLAVGTASYVLVAVAAGSLYGLAGWLSAALMISVDAVLRLVAILVVLAFTHDLVALAWAVVLPFPIALAVLWPVIRRSVVGHAQLDVGYRAVTWNVLRTVVAAASTGVMVSGFPLLLGITSPREPAALLGLFVLAITLTRAPLIVVAMSLQSYFTVTFRDAGPAFWRQFVKLLGLIAAAGGGLAILGCPAVFAFLFPGRLVPEGLFIAGLVISSAMVGAMCVSAPAVLARSQHFVYSLGWVVGAFATIGALLLPLDFTARTMTALFAGPTLGLFVHLGYLIVARRASTN